MCSCCSWECCCCCRGSATSYYRSLKRRPVATTRDGQRKHTAATTIMGRSCGEQQRRQNIEYKQSHSRISLGTEATTIALLFFFSFSFVFFFSFDGCSLVFVLFPMRAVDDCSVALLPFCCCCCCAAVCLPSLSTSAC